MAITYFTTVLKAIAVIPDGNDASDNEPETQNITALVTFTPSIREAQLTIDSALTTVRLEPIIGRLEEDGVLKTLDSTIGVGLICGDDAEGEPLYGLTYKVEFDKVVYNKQRSQKIEPFKFLAPTTADTVNLAEVERIA